MLRQTPSFPAFAIIAFSVLWSFVASTAEEDPTAISPPGEAPNLADLVEEMLDDNPSETLEAEPILPDPDQVAPPDLPVPGNIPPGENLLPNNDPETGPGTISGSVFDATSGKGLANVIVSLPGTNVRPQRTKENGSFLITGVPAGIHTVLFTRSGYLGSDREITIPAEPDTINISQPLEVRPIEFDDSEYLLEEYEVVGEYNEGGINNILLGQAETPGFMGGLGRADFKKAALSDAGDAVGKISGANIVDGKFAVVRGLADRYVATMFNNGLIASAEPSRKAVQLDLFPTAVLERVNVSKTHAPNLPGDFGGGTINIITRVFPEEQILSVQTKTSFDTDLASSFLVHPGRNLNFLGGNIGAELPNSLPEPPAADQLTLAGAWQGLHNSRTLLPRRADANPAQSFDAVYGQTFTLPHERRLGIMIAGGRGSEDSYNKSENFRNVRDGRTWTQEDFTRSVDWELYAAAGLEWNEDHRLDFVYFRKHIAEDTISHGHNLRDPGNDSLPFGNLDNTSGTRPYYGADALVLGSFHQIEPLERDFEVFQLSGNHQIGKRGPKINWSTTSSEAFELRPDTSFFDFATLDFASDEFGTLRAQQELLLVAELAPVVGLDPATSTWGEIRDSLVTLGLGALIPTLEANFPVVDESLGQVDTVATLNYNSAQGRGLKTTRLFQKIEEFSDDNKVDLSQPFYFRENSEDHGIEILLGGGLNQRMRSVRGGQYELFYEARGIGGDQGLSEDDILPGPDEDGNGLTNLGELIAQDPDLVSGLFNGSLIGLPGYVDASTGTGNNANKIFNNADGEHAIESYYLAARYFYDDFFFLGGVRFESEDRSAQLLEPKPVGAAGEDPPAIAADTYIPSATLGMSFLDDSLTILGAWSETIARPTFHEWMPIRTFDLASGIFRQGNPALSNSTINNFDLSATYNVNDDTALTLSFFHKTIEAPIVDVVSLGDSSLIQYINGGQGDLDGIELEADFRNLGPFSVKGNLTYIDATLTYPVSNAGLVTDTVVQFPYQPQWIANLNFGYENEEHQFSANLIYNYTGEYATLLRSIDSGSDVIQNAQHSLDLVVRKRFGDPKGAGFELSLGVKNLVSTKKILSYDGGREDVSGRQFRQTTNDPVYFLQGKIEF